MTFEEAKPEWRKAVSVELGVAGALEVEVLAIPAELDAHALYKSEQEFCGRLRLSAKTDTPITLHLEPVVEFEFPPAVLNNAIDKSARDKRIAVKCHSLVLECSGLVFQFPDSFVIRNSKVAEAGGVTSAPGGRACGNGSAAA